jgi:signal transduction histidine kinase
MSNQSLRTRLAVTFALFGILVSLLSAAGLFLTAHSLGLRLMDETLSAEIDDYLARKRVNPNALLPSTFTIRGYAHLPNQDSAGLAPELINLRPGGYQMTLDDIPYRIFVVDKARERFVMMFNATQQQRREQTFLAYIATGMFIMTLFSAWMGWWLAGKIVAPIIELARRVSNAAPEEGEQEISRGFSNDEIGTLAEVFGSYLRRMRAFIERERAFTADVSHELRTPLAIVQGVVELAEADDRLDDKMKERIARIGRANREMIDMTAALLLMAREEVPEEAVVQQCDVWDVVSHAIETYRHLLSAQTDIVLDCRSRIHVSAERTLLGIVVSNLIRNAFTYTQSGAVGILLGEDGLTITDTGSGISGEEIGRVFERYFKGAESPGSGIGLSLVKRICDRYGWRAEIRSTLGKGTSVRLFFHEPGKVQRLSSDAAIQHNEKR